MLKLKFNKIKIVKFASGAKWSNQRVKCKKRRKIEKENSIEEEKGEDERTDFRLKKCVKWLK